MWKLMRRSFVAILLTCAIPFPAFAAEGEEGSSSENSSGLKKRRVALRAVTDLHLAGDLDAFEKRLAEDAVWGNSPADVTLDSLRRLDFDPGRAGELVEIRFFRSADLPGLAERFPNTPGMWDENRAAAHLDGGLGCLAIFERADDPKGRGPFLSLFVVKLVDGVPRIVYIDDN